MWCVNVKKPQEHYCTVPAAFAYYVFNNFGSLYGFCSTNKAFEQGALSTDATFEFSRTDLETQDETLKQLEAEPSKTAKAVRAAIQKQRKERDKAPSVKQDKPMDAVAYLSIIKTILNKRELNHEQFCEVTKQLSAVVDYLTKTAGTV